MGQSLGVVQGLYGYVQVANEPKKGQNLTLTLSKENHVCNTERYLKFSQSS